MGGFVYKSSLKRISLWIFFVYTDDILSIAVNPMNVLIIIDNYSSWKPDSIHPPENYLGTKA